MLASLRVLHVDTSHAPAVRRPSRRKAVQGLSATSPRFDLSAAEHDFARRNSTHDAGYAAMQLTNWLVTAVCGVPVPASGGPTAARNEYVLACATGDIPDGVPPTVAAILRQHAAAAAARMNSFYWKLKLFGGEVDADYLAHTADGKTP